MARQLVGTYITTPQGKTEWVEQYVEIPDGGVLLIDELPTGAWADPQFCANVFDIMNKACVDPTIKTEELLTDIELEKMVYDATHNQT